MLQREHFGTKFSEGDDLPLIPDHKKASKRKVSVAGWKLLENKNENKSL